MQDEVNEKTIALYIKTGKLTAQTLQKAMKAILSKGKKQLSKPPQGKQSLKQLMKQNAGVSNIEIISFAVALTIRMPVSLIPSRSASSCRRCVFFSGGVSKRNWSTDIL